MRILTHNPFITTGLIVILLSSLSPSAGCSKSQTSTAKINAISIASDCDSNLAQRVASFVSRELDANINMHPMSPHETSSYNRNPSKMVKTLSDKYAFTVILLDNPARLPESKQVDNVSILSLNMLKPSTNDAEMFARRVEKETMRQIGRMIGMEDCPILACAMFRATNDSDLDTKSLNFCPPCSLKVEALLKAKGLLKSEYIQK